MASRERLSSASQVLNQGRGVGEFERLPVAPATTPPSDGSVTLLRNVLVAQLPPGHRYDSGGLNGIGSWSRRGVSDDDGLASTLFGLDCFGRHVDDFIAEGTVDLGKLGGRSR
jgi:hypothetical protein